MVRRKLEEASPAAHAQREHFLLLFDGNIACVKENNIVLECCIVIAEEQLH